MFFVFVFFLNKFTGKHISALVNEFAAEFEIFVLSTLEKYQQFSHMGPWSATVSMRDRVMLHKQQIRDPHTRMLRVSKHIDECAAGKTQQFTIVPFYKILYSSENTREPRKGLFLNTRPF